MEKVNELRVRDQIIESSYFYDNDKKVSKFIKTLLDERAKIKSKSQKTDFFSIILSTFFIFDLIPSLLPTLLFISIEPFSHMYHAMIWPLLSMRQKTYFFILRVLIRTPFIVKTSPILIFFLKTLIWGVSNSPIAFRVVLFTWFLTSIFFFLLLPWSISNYLSKNGYYQNNILHAHS